MAQKRPGEWAKRVTATAVPMPRSASRRWWWIAPLLLAAAGVGVWIAMRGEPAPPVQPTPLAQPSPAAEPTQVAAPAPFRAPAASASSAPAQPVEQPVTPSGRGPIGASRLRTPNLTRGRLLDPWHK